MYYKYDNLHFKFISKWVFKSYEYEIWKTEREIYTDIYIYIYRDRESEIDIYRDRERKREIKRVRKDNSMVTIDRIVIVISHRNIIIYNITFKTCF